MRLVVKLEAPKLENFKPLLEATAEGREISTTMAFVRALTALVRIARDNGLAVVGPNCMGVWDLTTNTSIYIGDVSPYLPRGGIAGIAQSGSVADAFIHSGSRIGFCLIGSSIFPT